MSILTLECPLNEKSAHTGPTDTGGFGHVGVFYIENGNRVPSYVLTRETLMTYENIGKFMGDGLSRLRKEEKKEEKK